MKHLFTLINIILLTLAVALIVQFMYQRFGLKEVSVSKDMIQTQPLTIETGHKKAQSYSFNQQYAVIGSRNLFQVSTDEKTNQPATIKNTAKVSENISIATSQLTLKGTATGLSEIYAVIEDKKRKRQDFYMVGDTIQDTLVKAIYKDHVILEYNGEEQRLEMTIEDNRPRGMAASPTTPVPPPPAESPKPANVNSENIKPGTNASEDEKPDTSASETGVKQGMKPGKSRNEGHDE